MDKAIQTSYKTKKLIMWYKVRELQLKGFTKSCIARTLSIDRGTVRRYLKMSEDEFLGSAAYIRKGVLKLKKYEKFVREALEKYPSLSAAQIHDWLKEYDPELPGVCEKTVFNFVRSVRKKYRIPKMPVSKRVYEKQPDTPYGEFAQADFGEAWMKKADGKSIKIYFFAAVLSRSRYKFIYFSRLPFDTEHTVYAHELAFHFWGGKPRKIVYDQDKVLISKENLGDYALVKGFRTLVNEQHFQPVFCRKSDPESKGKIENVVKYVKRNFLLGRTFYNIDYLNKEGLEWLERTGNGKVHGTTGLVPAHEFETEREYLMPYRGVPQQPSARMREYRVRKDNTISYRGNYYSLPWGTYKDGNSTVWLLASGGMLELYDKESGKLLCRHKICDKKGQFISDGRHRKPHVHTESLATRILIYAHGNMDVRSWLERLKQDKPRYYRDNLEVLLRVASRCDSRLFIHAVRQCLEENIFNGYSVEGICKALHENGRHVVEDGCPIKTSGELSQYNRIFKQ